MPSLSCFEADGDVAERVAERHVAPECRRFTAPASERRPVVARCWLLRGWSPLIPALGVRKGPNARDKSLVTGGRVRLPSPPTRAIPRWPLGCVPPPRAPAEPSPRLSGGFSHTLFWLLPRLCAGSAAACSGTLSFAPGPGAPPGARVTLACHPLLFACLLLNRQVSGRCWVTFTVTFLACGTAADGSGCSTTACSSCPVIIGFIWGSQGRRRPFFEDERCPHRKRRNHDPGSLRWKGLRRGRLGPDSRHHTGVLSLFDSCSLLP